MPTPNKDVAAATQSLSLFWQNFFVWLAGFLVFLTLVKIFEYIPRPAEISLIEMGFFAGVFTLCTRHFAAAKSTGQSKWAALVEVSISLVMVLGLLSVITWGTDWLADRFAGNWRVAARIINADIVWLGCFLLAIYHPESKSAATSETDSETATEAKP